MEIDNLKKMWKEDNMKLEDSLKLNLELIKKINLDKSLPEFDQQLKITILGRNLTLLYGAISLATALIFVKEPLYSILLFASTAAMIWSFVHHLKIKKPKDFNEMSVLQIQKAIYTFRIHTIHSKNYDLGVLLFWLFSFSPLLLRFFDVDIIHNMRELSYFIGGTVLFILCTIFMTNTFYKYLTDRLAQAENQLDEVLEFEKTTSKNN